MMYKGKITALREKGSSIDIVVNVADDSLAAAIKNKRARNVLLCPTDGRRITPDQRKKIYATLRDISNHTGYPPEEAKQIMKFVYVEKTAGEYFSLSDCSVDTARVFLNVLTDFCLEHGVITTDMLTDRTDDIDTYLTQCIRHRKCGTGKYTTGMRSEWAMTGNVMTIRQTGRYACAGCTIQSPIRRG